jgi:hypothetical protein
MEQHSAGCPHSNAYAIDAAEREGLDAARSTAGAAPGTAHGTAIGGGSILALGLHSKAGVDRV